MQKIDQNAIFLLARWRHIYVRRNSIYVVPPCEWILHTLTSDSAEH